MEKLKEIVKELTDIEEKGPVGRSKRVRVLQKLNEMLLSEYDIKINDGFIIKPLLVEAYYYHEGKFEDGNTHKADKQKSDPEDRFGKLYFHEKGWGGIDICLSRGNYYLSFLIKNSIIDKQGKKEFCKQQKLYEELNNIRKNDSSIENKPVLINRPEKDKQIIFRTVRKGLSGIEEKLSEKQLSEKKRIECEKKLPFVYERLAAVKGFDLRDSNGKPYEFDLEKGFSKGTIAAEYIHEYAKYGHMFDSEVDYDEIVQKILGEGWKKSSIKRQLEEFE